MLEDYEKINLSSFRAKFTQDGNTLGTTEEVELLEVECEAQLGDIGDGSAFLVLRTPEGWSMDTPEDLSRLLKHVVSAAEALAAKVDEKDKR